MILLLAGLSEVGRAAVASKFVKEQAQWRHLPLEQLGGITEMKQMDTSDPAVLLRIACQCALELENEGYHLLITSDYHPAAHAIMQDELGAKAVSVHIGPTDEVEESDFPHKFESTNLSPNDIYASLCSVLAR